MLDQKLLRNSSRSSKGFEKAYIEELNIKHRETLDTIKAGKPTDEVLDTLTLSQKYIRTIWINRHGEPKRNTQSAGIGLIDHADHIGHEMVSAAKLKKAQDAITAMRPYSDKLPNWFKT